MEKFETATLTRETLSLPYNLTSCVKQSYNSKEQVKEAKKKIKPVNNELREIVSFLLDGQRTRAGALLSKYTDKPKVKELMGFFIKQPPPVQYELGQVYRKALGVDENLALAIIFYKQAAERNHPKGSNDVGLHAPQWNWN